MCREDTGPLWDCRNHLLRYYTRRYSSRGNHDLHRHNPNTRQNPPAATRRTVFYNSAAAHSAGYSPICRRKGTQIRHPINTALRI